MMSVVYPRLFFRNYHCFLPYLCTITVGYTKSAHRRELTIRSLREICTDVLVKYQHIKYKKVVIPHMNYEIIIIINSKEVAPNSGAAVKLNHHSCLT